MTDTNISRSLEALHNRVETLQGLLETVRSNPCFDEEDATWVEDDLRRAHAKQKQDEARVQELLTTETQLQYEQDKLTARERVLTDVDEATGVLRHHPKLCAKFVTKQKKLQTDLNELRQRLDQLL